MEQEKENRELQIEGGDDDDYDDDDPTDEEEHSRPELAPVIPFRGGPDGKPDDPA